MNRPSLIVVAACAATLGACGGESHQDLRGWVKEQDSMQRPRIEPLPDVKPMAAVAYGAFDLESPFKPRSIKPPSGTDQKLQPDLNRRKEALESYPLENLRMVGTLAQKKDTFALIKTPDNNLFRVKTGNYMGQNFGLITAIGEAEVKLKEIVQDSGGDWIERFSTLQLADEQTEVVKR